MNGALRVGKLFGIPFYINPSWFLVLGLVTWTYGSGLAAEFPLLATGQAFTLGLIAALLLFSSVIAHELGHSFVAIRQGINVKSITLFIFGGLASLEKESDTPGSAFWVAIAGPLVSIALFGLFTLTGTQIDPSTPVAAIVGLLATVNLALAAFNLIPGLPLDGGNILKAIVWKITGNPYKGVVFASRIGQIFGWLAIASAVVPFFLFGTFGNYWNILLGFFLLQNAGNSAQYGRVQEKLAGLTAADVVSSNSPVVSGNLTIREFADSQIFHPKNYRRFLVKDDSDRLVGFVSVDALGNIPTAEWSNTKIESVTQPIDTSSIVRSDRPLLDVVGLLETQKLSALAVTEDNGVLVGILEKAAIVNLLQHQPQVKAA